MKFELTKTEQMCVEMYAETNNKDNPDLMKGVLLFQSLKFIHNSETLQGMFYGFYDGGGI